jgi:hypothetical protein
MKEPKLNQEKLEIPNDSKIKEEIDNKKEIEKEQKEPKEEPKENESKEEKEESKEKKEESEEKEEEEPKNLEEEEDEEPKNIVEEKETKEEKEEMEEQAQPIIKVEERENNENNEEKEQNEEQEQEQEQNEEIQNDGMKTPTKGKLYRFIQNGQIFQVDDKGEVYKVVQESQESSKENQAINESYELNQENNNNVVNIIYHDIAFRSGQKEENNINREIKNEKIKNRLLNISKRKEPKDSNPKVHILSRKKSYKKYNEKVRINSELTDISKNEIGNKEYTMVIGDGMETGEYKFIGEKILIKENIAPNEKIMITEEEIKSELNKRKNKKKEKKLKYEVIDKFYALTNISIRTIKKLEKDSTKKEQKNYFYSTLNTNNMNINSINNTNMNMKMNNTFSGMNSQYNNYESFASINMPIQNRIQNMNMSNMMNMPNMNISMPFDNYSRYFLSQVNKIRTEPQSFIGVIEDSKANIIKDRLGRIIYNGKIKVALNAGEAAFDEAIEYLKELNPMQPLTYNQMITANTPVSENEILDKNDLTYKIESMINSGINIKSYWRDVIKDPEISFLLMIIDDNGIKSGMRRKDILSPYMKYIGISSAEINNNFVCYVTLA